MQFGDFVRYELGPGFSANILPTPKFKTITIKLFVHRPLSTDATRIALLESVLRRGCRRTPNMQRISMFLDSLYGASFDSDVSKIGERQLMVSALRVVNDRFAPTRIGVLEKSLDFLARMLLKPVEEAHTLKKDYVRQEKVNLRRFLESLVNDRIGFAMQRCIQAMCEGEPYERYEYGRIEEIEPITREELTELHEQIVRTSPVELYVVGDVSPETVARQARAAFAPLVRRQNILSIPDPHPGHNGRPVKEIVETIEVEQAKLIIACRTGMTLRDPDFGSVTLLNGILGAFPHSRLFANVREKAGLCYQASSFVDGTKGLLFMTLGIDAANYARVRSMIDKELDAIRSGRISDDELEKTKRVLTTILRMRDDSPGSKIHATLESSINRRVETTPQNVARIQSVTKDDIARAAQRLRIDTIYLLRR